MRTKLVGVALAMLFIATVVRPALPVSNAAEAPMVGVLKSGAALFWKGGLVSDVVGRVVNVASTASEACVEAGPCWTYRLKLDDRAAQFRVAIDVPQRKDAWKTTIVDPKGTSTMLLNANAFNAESFFAKPEPGTWSVTVAPLTAQYSSFRLRAKLEAEAYAPPKQDLYLPNLRVPRLWEFGFVAPVTGLAGVSMDDANPPVEAAGQHPMSCTVDETQAGAHRCLRMSFQMVNAGDGNFDVRFDTTGNPLLGKMVQCIRKTDGSLIARDAGEFDYHAVHAHYHYKDVVLHELFLVGDRDKGTMTRVGVGEKTGYHPADQSFAEWDRFVQAPSGTSTSSGNCYAASNNQIGLSRGWGDAYRWQRPGNFVEFGTNPDGFYVVRTTADPLNHLLESNESDNSGYAYIHVVGDEVALLEQGQGESPWDPHKVVNAY